MTRISNNAIRQITEVAAFIEKLPDESLLKSAKTYQQTSYWELIRGKNFLLARCWKARFSGSDDPLFEFLENGELKTWIHEAVWLQVDYWETIWGLCQLGERYLKAAVKKAGAGYPFESASELFQHILSRAENETYLECLKPYSTEFSVKEIKKTSKLEIKRHQKGLNQIDSKNLEAFAKKYTRPESHIWMRLLLHCCRENAKQNYALSAKLESYDMSIEREARFSLKLINVRDPETNSPLRSCVWKNGERVMGNSKGTYG